MSVGRSAKTTLDGTRADALVAGARLRRQGIEGARLPSAEAVVRSLTAVQAQDYGQALWAIGLRTEADTATDVERSLAKARIVRTWPMRGTIHFVPAEDAAWMLALSAPRMLARDGRRLQSLQLTLAILERSVDLFRRALAGAQRLSRAAMLNLLEEAGISTAGQRGYHLLWHASQTGVICPGPMIRKGEAREQSFVLLNEWITKSRRFDRDAALAELARRYFRGHGPATMRDLAWWAGLPPAEARAAIAGARADLVEVSPPGPTREDQRRWVAKPTRGARSPVATPAHGTHLLPGFDEYLIGYTDRSAVLPAAYAARIVPGRNGVFMPTIVVDGQIVGTWQRQRKRQAKSTTIDITLVPFKRTSGLRQKASAAAERHCTFWESSLGRLNVA